MSKEEPRPQGRRIVAIVWPFAVAGVATLVWMSSGPQSSGPVATHLIESFETATITGSAGPSETPSPVELRFDSSPLELTFQPGPGIAELRLDDGRLVGRTTTDTGLLQIAVEQPLGLGDRLHALEVRIRTSAGQNLSLELHDDDEVDLDKAAANASPDPGPFFTPLVNDGESHTYTIAVANSFHLGQPLSNIHSLVVRPSDIADADFAIESVRLIFRREYLAGLPSGPGWQGLSEVWRESLVTRSPEQIHLEIELPDRPWLDLMIGTIEDGPVTFEIRSELPDGTNDLLLRRTVTTPNRWQPAPIDLADHAGKTITLVLETTAEEPGRVAFWGNPVVRNRLQPIDNDQPATERAPRGVLLILTDTLRRDHLPMYGYERSTAPNLLRLAEEGVVFEDNISQGTWTKISVPSILASLYPSSHGIVDITDRLPAAADTLAETFRAAGYATWASSSVPFTGQLSNLHQGVEVLHERASVELPEGVGRSKTARVFTDRLLDWLETHQDTPFFVVLHVFDAHDPFLPYRPYDTLWADPERQRQFEEMVDKVRPEIKEPFLRRLGLPTSEEMAAAGVPEEPFIALEKDLYDGSIRAMDTEIGRLLEGLETLGLADDTIVALIADHGEEFLEHGRHFHGQSVYGEMTNVPLLLWAPGRLLPEQRIADTVQSLDLAPTLVELAGLETPTGFQGRSLLPLVATVGADSPSARERSLAAGFSERVAAPSERAVNPRTKDSISIVSDGWRLIHNLVRPDDAPEYELYDHRADPLNAHDLAADQPEVVERLAADLAAWHKWAQAERLAADEVAAADMSAAELEQLRSLGYVQ